MDIKLKAALIMAAGVLCASNVSAENLYKKISKMSIVPQSEFKSETEIRQDLEELIENKQFSQITALVQDALKKENLYDDGKMYHTIYVEALAYNNHSPGVKAQNFYEKKLKLAEEWVAKEPNSAVAYINLATAHRAQAWVIRGDQYVQNTDPDRLKKYVEMIESNINFLLEHKEVVSQDPFYYVILGYDLKELGLLEQSVGVYYEGIAKYPRYRTIYNTFLSQFTDRWSGHNVEAAAQIVQDIQEHNPDHKDRYYYHILYTAQNSQYKATNFNVDWDRVEKGAVETLELLPTLNRVGQVYALYCSYPGNKQRLLKLNKALKLNDTQDPVIKMYTERCPE